MLWGAWGDAGRLAVASRENEPLARRLLSALDGLTLWAPGLVVQQYPAGEYEQLEAFLNNDASDQADRLRQTNAMLGHDVRRGFANADAGLAEAIIAQTMIVVFDQDHMVNPGPSMAIASSRPEYSNSDRKLARHMDVPPLSAALSCR